VDEALAGVLQLRCCYICLKIFLILNHLTLSTVLFSHLKQPFLK